jgi:hypothetical protein
MGLDLGSEEKMIRQVVWGCDRGSMIPHFVPINYTYKLEVQIRSKFITEDFVEGNMKRVYWFETATGGELQIVSGKLIIGIRNLMHVQVKKGLFRKQIIKLTSIEKIHDHVDYDITQAIVLYMKQIERTLVPLSIQETHQAHDLVAEKI